MNWKDYSRQIEKEFPTTFLRLATITDMTATVSFAMPSIRSTNGAPTPNTFTRAMIGKPIQIRNDAMIFLKRLCTEH